MQGALEVSRGAGLRMGRGGAVLVGMVCGCGGGELVVWGVRGFGERDRVGLEEV